MSSFDDCLAFILRPDIEGGDVNNPQDPGGRTRKGVTQKTYDLWRHKHSLPSQDVFAMSDGECAELYLEEYWDPSPCSALEKPVALYVFDMSVNMGIETAIKILQRAAAAPDDGIFGPVTAQHVRTTGTLRMLGFLRDYRAAYYRLSKRFDVFGAGWLDRNRKCYALALSWANQETG